ncbi:Proteasome, alpha-subunit, N-terminal domain-containing protein [Artemisia annua]|uniref:Proteasome, alpha-subunit, N-terminal domain-containing protein n=1 Tax=Artemisia annua TaxID=35608 RepID=A0A2U1NFT7_ARTAN|nr:Proteasome, alpha-subunit, N-terminal domain-containing protein [Artemisia annua]
MSIVVRGKDSVCVVTRKKDKLLDPTSVTHLLRVTRFLGLLATGTTVSASITSSEVPSAFEDTENVARNNLMADKSRDGLEYDVLTSSSSFAQLPKNMDWPP